MTNSKGFTLIELGLTLSISAVLILLSFSSFYSFRQHQKINTIISALNQSINYARLQAVINNTNIIIQPINLNWQNGWMIKHNDKILKNTSAMPYEILFSHSKIIFQPDSMAEGYNGTFVINHKVEMVISRGGRTEIKS